MPDLSVVIITMATNVDNTPVMKAIADFEPENIEVIVRSDPGIARARNRGIEEAEAKKIVFLDDDSVPHRGYFETAGEALDEHKAVAGRVLQPATDIMPKNVDLYDRGTAPKTVSKVVGCNMGFRKELFEEIGYFNEVFEWGYEEIELSDRINKVTEIYYEPEMIVTHPYAESLREFWHKEYLGGESEIYYWTIQGVPLSKRIKRSAPLNLWQGDLTTTVGWILRKAGRIKGNLRQLYPRNEVDRYLSE